MDDDFSLKPASPGIDRGSPSSYYLREPAPDGGRVPLSQVADVAIREGSFMIFREGGRRYIPIKFSVRGRDLAATITDLQNQIRSKVMLPPGYTYTWAGEFDSLRKEQQRLAVIIPISLAVVFLFSVLCPAWESGRGVAASLPVAVPHKVGRIG